MKQNERWMLRYHELMKFLEENHIAGWLGI